MGTAGRNNVLTSPLSSLHALLYLPFHLPSPLLLLATLYLPLYLPRSILPPRTIHLTTPHLPHNFPSPLLLTLVLLPLPPISTFETVGRNNVYQPPFLLSIISTPPPSEMTFLTSPPFPPTPPPNLPQQQYRSMYKTLPRSASYNLPSHQLLPPPLSFCLLPPPSAWSEFDNMQQYKWKSFRNSNVIAMKVGYSRVLGTSTILLTKEISL